MISCPDCGYCPEEERQKIPIEKLSPMEFSMLSFGYNELDYFEVVGCLPGKIMCPKCSCHFFPRRYRND